MSQTGTESNAGARPDGGPTTLTTQVYGRLRGEIIGGQLKPNEKLRLAALRQRLGVGMSAIREALSRLAAEGLVIAEDQRGFRVSPVSREDLEDLTRVRIEIERHLARAAGPGARAQRRTAQAAAGPRRPKPSAAKRTAKK